MRTVSRWLAALGLLAVAATVSSCNWIGTGLHIDAAQAGAQQPGASDVADMDALDGEAAAARRKPPPAPKVKPRPPSAVAAAPADVDAAAVVGLSEDQVENLLGPPKSQAVLPPARIREYVNRECTLRLYFYVDLKTSQYRVLHLETASEGSGADETRHCLTQIARHATRAREP